jgi:tetratricopeptide (TPR) repeat protein
MASLLAAVLPVFTQQREVLFSQAAQLFHQGDYPEAADAYLQLYHDDTTNLFVAFRLAECYRHDSRYSDAAKLYHQVITLPEAVSEYPESWFYLAMMRKQTGDVEGFCEYITQYISQGNDPQRLQRARYEQKICTDTTLLQTDSLPVLIQHLGKNVNTPYSEFGAFQPNDSVLVFSALRPAVTSEFQSFALLDYRTAVYASDIGPGGYRQAKEMHRIINRKNTHNANISYDKAGDRIFFSRCAGLDQGLIRCRIMTSTYRKGRWRRPKALPDHINMPDYTNTQPQYIRIGEMGVLYFVSDRPGGFGGMDVWYALEHDGEFNKPINCGSIINTPGNEVTPFYDTTRGVLFFSSDYHHGFGGYDIFGAEGGLSAWNNTANLGIPFNSPANDYYFTVNPNDSNGYFTSNRPGSMHLRGETCCNDIYYYSWMPPEPTTPPDPATPLVENPDSVSELAGRLLPLLLFFHNDEPDQATMRTTSTKDYRQTLDEYIALRPLYRNEYARGLSRDAADQAVEDIDDFFESYVLGGYEKLGQLTSYLLADLNAGRSVQLLISGYCSPLSTTEYNINLARRRIHSLVKYLEEYRGGVLSPFINEKDPDKVRLLIFEDPVGKEKASPFVSDNPHDLRNSVYSRAAAFERRIEISIYLSHKPGEAVMLSELPVFEIESDTVILDTMEADERRVVNITYRNTGASELLIRDVLFNGDHIWVQWSNEPLLPGHEKQLRVLVMAGKKTGPLQETISINTNLPDPTSVTIKTFVDE